MPQYPHQFGDGCLAGHVLAFQHAVAQRFLSDLIDAEITLFIQTLTADDNRDASLGHLLKLRRQIPPDKRQPADSEGLDHHAAAGHLNQRVEQLWIHARDQLDQDDFLAQLAAQLKRTVGMRKQPAADIQSPAVDPADRFNIDAFERLEIRRTDLHRAGAQ